MNDKLFDNELNTELDKKIAYLKRNNFCLTEQDFYTPSDNRTWKSGVGDINGGDNFAEFCEEFFELLDREEYFEI